MASVEWEQPPALGKVQGSSRLRGPGWTIGGYTTDSIRQGSKRASDTLHHCMYGK